MKIARWQHGITLPEFGTKVISTGKDLIQRFIQLDIPESLYLAKYAVTNLLPIPPQPTSVMSTLYVGLRQRWSTLNLKFLAY